MNQEFLDFFERELSALKEHAGEFTDEYPGIADRLGKLVDDPMIRGLLEGAAFLSARVQLKLKQEFPEFTANLLEQIAPGYLAPMPSAVLLSFTPPYSEPALSEGRTVRRHATLDASYVEAKRRIACTFRLCTDVVLWPFEIVEAEYLPGAAQIVALGVSVENDRVVAGLRLTLARRTAARPDDEPKHAEALKTPATWFANCRADSLPIYLQGAPGEADQIYEQVVGNCVNVAYRFVNADDQVVHLSAPPTTIGQLGLAEEDAMVPSGKRVFHGFDLLREYFSFPRRFLGFTLNGLARILPHIRSNRLDVVLTFDRLNAKLSAVVHKGVFALHTAPAVNLFRKTADRITLLTGHHEYRIIPDRSRPQDFEAHSVLDVVGFRAGSQAKVEIPPLYAAPPESAGHSWSLRRDMRRRRSDREREPGTESYYDGTEIFLSLVEPAEPAGTEGIAELGVTALCSNRYLAAQLPVGESGADFTLSEDTDLKIRCVDGPTAPRAPLLANFREGEAAYSGALTWRFINMLALNHLGLTARGAREGADALREILMVFSDLSDSAAKRKIRGIRSVESRPVIRRIRHRAGTAVGRGLEITVTIDERAFEGSGVFLLGAILDRFFAEYVAINNFTQTVIRSVDRGVIMRWPPRAGLRRLM